MKYFFTIVAIVLTISIIIASCDRTITVEDVIVEFWFSNDGGVTYFQGDGYHRGWGSSFFMKLEVQVHTNSKRTVFPTVSLQIGNSNNISSHIIGGSTVNTREGTFGTVYDFTTPAVKNNDNFSELFVEFIPDRPGDIEIYVEFELDGIILEEFKIDYGIKFLCRCESIIKNTFGDYSGYDEEELDSLRLECNCSNKDCEYCFHEVRNE
jgi:hypothetical protein